MRLLHKISLFVAILLLTTSCSWARLAKLGDQVEVLQIERVELKGFTAIQVVVELRNDSKYEIAMEGATVTLYSDGEKLATLSQVGSAVAAIESKQSIKTLWRIENIDPMAMLSLSSRIAKRDMTGVTIDYSAELSAGKIKRTISAEGVDITKFIAIFAS